MRQLILLMLVIQCLLHGATAMDKPNFLIIAIDDLNDYVGCLDGHPNASTPNLDRLAKQGVLFTNAHCNSPVCNPSRAAIWTGLRPTTTGVHSNPAGWFREKAGFENVVTLTQSLGLQGYRTWGYGKLYHVGHTNRTNGEWQRFNSFGYGPLQSPKLNYEGRGFRLTDWGITLEGSKPSYDEDIAQRTINALEDVHDKPFLLGCGFFRPHTPIYASKTWFNKHPLKSVRLPPGAVEGDTKDLVYFGVKERRPQDVEAPGLWKQDWVENNGKWKEILQAYLASTSAMDHQLGRVVDALSESDHADDTYLICFSDHGWHLGEKRHWGKAALWEQTTRVPFIISGPGIPKGVICDQPVELISIYPTVMDYAGLKPPHKLEGHSLRPLLEDVNADWNHPALTTFVDHHALRTDRWRYIRYSVEGEELYDMVKDPHELNNLAVTQAQDLKVKNTLKNLSVQLDQLLSTHAK